MIEQSLREVRDRTAAYWMAQEAKDLADLLKDRDATIAALKIEVAATKSRTLRWALDLHQEFGGIQYDNELREAAAEAERV